MKTKLPAARQDLLKRVGMELGREISAQTVFFHELAARKLGLNATDTRCLDFDTRCLDFIGHAGASPVTAGDLGRATGLTTGAVTGILDRLEKAGMVERWRDPADRRKVVVRPKPEAARRAGALYDKLGAAMMKLASSYQTEELELIDDFLERSLAVLKEQVESLRFPYQRPN